MIATIQPEALAQKIAAKESICLVDVRQEWEYAHCHLGDSILIPLPELAGRMEELPKKDGMLYVVYCHHGVRSLTGATLLQQAGFGPVASLAGGIEAWSVYVDPQMPRY